MTAGAGGLGTGRGRRPLWGARRGWTRLVPPSGRRISRRGRQIGRWRRRRHRRVGRLHRRRGARRRWWRQVWRRRRWRQRRGLRGRRGRRRRALLLRRRHDRRSGRPRIRLALAMRRPVLTVPITLRVRIVWVVVPAGLVGRRHGQILPVDRTAPAKGRISRASTISEVCEQSGFWRVALSARVAAVFVARNPPQGNAIAPRARPAYQLTSVGWATRQYTLTGGSGGGPVDPIIWFEKVCFALRLITVIGNVIARQHHNDAASATAVTGGRTTSRRRSP